MRIISTYAFILVILLSACRVFNPGSVSIVEEDLENNPNVIETSPNYYLEFIGLKNYSAKEIVDSMRVKQRKTITGAGVLTACSSVMQKDLGFEYSSTNYVRPNYGYITVIESKKDYGIVEKSLPADSLNTISKWNIPGKNLHDYSNQTYLGFYIQFLRTDGKELSMKYKMLYKQFATKEEKAFSDGLIDHINSLNYAEALPKARETLKSDGNLINRYWSLLIMMKAKPTDEDLKLLFDQYYYQDNNLKMYTSYVLRELLKIRPDVNWNELIKPTQNLISGAAIWNYDVILTYLTDSGFPSSLSDQVLDFRSPILMDYLNAYEPGMSEIAFNFIKTISNGGVSNKKEANQWLTSKYEKRNLVDQKKNPY